MNAPRAVALGGGHGLSASLQALRPVAEHLTAIVTVGDDGGSSGVLRRELGVLPPGDLRMAVAALAGHDAHGRLWSGIVQHRFDRGTLAGHPVGNVLLVALTERLGDPVAALAAMTELTGGQGIVLPMAVEPVDLVADLVDDDGTIRTVRGQVAVASAQGRVSTVSLDPPEPKPCVEAVQAVLDADLVVLGPGSWFTSVVPHLLVPEIRSALTRTQAVRVVTLNLIEQVGETSGFSPQNHLEVLSSYAPDLTIDVVIADRAAVTEADELREAAMSLGAQLLLADVREPGSTGRHAPIALASAYAQAWQRGRIRP